MIWSAEEGKLVDSFQQNYDKRLPKYVALRKHSSGEVYDPTLKELFFTKTC